MRNHRNKGPHAFVDESYVHERSSDPKTKTRLYTMTALVVDDARKARGRATEQLSGRAFHGSDADDERRRAMLDHLGSQEGVLRVVTAVRDSVPDTRDGLREARKHCLTELVAQLSQENVTGMTLDQLWQGSPEASEAEQRRDHDTINECKRAGLAPASLKAGHANHRGDPGVQLADGATWWARTAVERGDARALAPIAHKVRLVAALRVPADQRDNATRGALQQRLDRLADRAKHSKPPAAKQPRRVATQLKGGLSNESLDRLAALKESLDGGALAGRSTTDGPSRSAQKGSGNPSPERDRPPPSRGGDGR